MNAFLTALAFLTRIPVRGNDGNLDPNDLAKSIIFFPAAGAIIGALNACLYLLLVPVLPQSVLAVFIIAFPIFLSGGIHFDGLLDTCDGLFSGASRDRILEIMRDSRVGSMGVIAGIMNIMMRYSILIALPAALLPFLLIAQSITSRWVMALALYFFPYVRKGGGLGQGFSEGKTSAYVLLSSLLAVLLVLLINGYSGLIIFLIVGGISLLIAVWVARRIGGLTGDVYGALNEAAEIIFLLLWLMGHIAFQIFP